MQNLKLKMEQLPKNSKQWWSLNKRLLNRQAAPSLFPPLKKEDGTWCRTPKTKADAFAICWAAKCKLPPELFEHFFCQVAEGMAGWFPIRARDMKKILLNLREDQATGPDGISAKLIKDLRSLFVSPSPFLLAKLLWKVNGRIDGDCII